ncbi:L-2-amino-thiazoline-4-carboxylic acid hydrolase [Enterococcus ureasiticus]|uniref:L-2-amino-thiazoline-4-carboxylic acid hydrolase n=1 Tax=Enterococcus ureasiticus TaxID=903984 RepID=UPI001A8D6365|nr:L-2-amino-thiazoline-4-carboxylic acid hydrolase [Enterococcus ureasiticus]MBO0474397.1 L-2-amino-thiazoline-4-carboxylic acid hydrolase [Enterococcus ureasiticus]
MKYKVEAIQKIKIMLDDKYFEEYFKSYTKEDFPSFQKNVKNRAENEYLDIVIRMDIDFNNPFTVSLIEAIFYFSIIAELQSLKWNKNMIKETIHNYYQKQLIDQEEHLKDIGKTFFTMKNVDTLVYYSQSNQDNQFKEDYIVKYDKSLIKKGKLTNKTYQCPICFFSKKADVFDSLNIICELDFIRSKFMNTNLSRTYCLAASDSYCDFIWEGKFS